MAIVDHYATLGVSRTADVATIRKAWIREARKVHPDGQFGSSDDETRRAGVRMLAVNEAWRVLEDPRRRSQHDRELRRRPGVVRDTPSGSSRPTGATTVDEVEESMSVETSSAPLATVLRVLPWLLIGGLGLGIFIMTAFASNSRSEVEVEPVDPGPECVRLREDGTVRPVPCAWENDGVIIEAFTLTTETRECDDVRARRHEASIHSIVICLLEPELVGTDPPTR